MPEGSYSFPVGEMRCTVLSDGYFSYPAEWFFASVEPGRVRRTLMEHRLPPDEILSPYTCLLIETGRHVILSDTGAGPGSSTTGAIVARLEMAGLRPQHIDTVILSHAHPDHIGGTIDASGGPAFPNARYVMAETEWEFWTGWRTDLQPMDVPADFKKDLIEKARCCLTALRFQVELICGETEIIPGVTAIPAPGHTPGHLALLLSSGREQLLNIGDAAMHPIHLEQPSWDNALDLAPSSAALVRRSLLERATAEEMRVMGFHFPFPSIGRVEPLAAGGWRWSPGW